MYTCVPGGWERVMLKRNADGNRPSTSVERFRNSYYRSSERNIQTKLISMFCEILTSVMYAALAALSVILVCMMLLMFVLLVHSFECVCYA